MKCSNITVLLKLGIWSGGTDCSTEYDWADGLENDGLILYPELGGILRERVKLIYSPGEFVRLV